MYEKSKCVEFGFALGHRFVAVELPRKDARVLVPLADGKAAAASGQRADFAWIVGEGAGDLFLKIHWYDRLEIQNTWPTFAPAHRRACSRNYKAG